MDEPAYNDEICEPKYERYPEKQLCSLGHVILPGDGLVASILPVFPRSSVRVPNGKRKLRLRPPNLQSRELYRRSRQVQAMLGKAQARDPQNHGHRP